MTHQPVASLHRLVIEAAAADPAAVAVGDATAVPAERIVDYGTLNGRANALAHRLRALGVRRGDRVLLWGEKSAAVITAMQAVLRLGAVYVPADGTTPPSRVAGLARDCGARAVLSTWDRSAQLRDELGDGIRYDDLNAPLTPHAEQISVEVAPDDPAYILYTSGSTGRPKGVCISHRNARAFVDWAVTELKAGPADRFANHAAFTFDLSVLDLYAAFAAHASVHLIPAELAYAPVELVRFVRDQAITVWYSVPSALTLMMREGGLLDHPAPGALRAVLFAGEPFPIAQVRDLASWTDARLLNLYGPTETNVCTFHEVVPADLRRDRPVPIGRPASGDRVWARGADGSHCREGEEGILVVDGPTVMLGYWGQPPQRGPYDTGDVVRALPGGAYDYVGRRDHMAKVRGNRVELGEVEAAMTAHPEVAEAGAVVVGQGIDARLVVFVVPKPGRSVGVIGLRAHNAKRLPRYMLADDINIVAALPRTGNGKLDRLALAARSGDGATNDQDPVRVGSHSAASATDKPTQAPEA